MPRNTQALILSGSEQMFLNNAEQFKSYLVEEAGYSADNIFLRSGTKAKAFSEISPASSPFVLAYFGHGSPNHMAPTSKMRISYKSVADWLKEQKDFLFINDTCYAQTAKAPLEEQRLLERGQLIAATRENAYAYNKVFLNHLLDASRSHQPLRRKRISSKYRFGNMAVVTSKNNHDTEDERVTDDGTIVFKLQSLHIQYKTYKREVPAGTIQYPQRSGQPLDYLLYPIDKKRSKAVTKNQISILSMERVIDHIDAHNYVMDIREMADENKK